MAELLVVEDDPMLRDALVGAFSRRGYAVRAAASGNAAIAILEADPEVAVIVSDYYMPDGDGGQLLAFVRGRDPDRPAFIVVTGQADATTEELLGRGAQRLLQKPVPVRELVAVVAQYLAPR